ncbi:MAG: sigma-70 family RNA polymerase sigma factor [Acidobacteriota bacterium]
MARVQLSPEADRRLIARLQGGEEAAMREVARLFGPMIQQQARRRLSNHEDAEEVTQDVLLAVWRQIRSFRQDAALSSWIYRITLNATMTRLRAGGRAKRRGVSVPLDTTGDTDFELHHHHRAALADATPAPDERVVQAETRQTINRAVATLPRDMRHAVLLRYTCGLSPQESGALLRVNPQTMRTRLNRGRRLLRLKLAAARLGDGPPLEFRAARPAAPSQS